MRQTSISCQTLRSTAVVKLFWEHPVFVFVLWQDNRIIPIPSYDYWYHGGRAFRSRWAIYEVPRLVKEKTTSWPESESELYRPDRATEVRGTFSGQRGATSSCVLISEESGGWGSADALPRGPDSLIHDVCARRTDAPICFIQITAKNDFVPLPAPPENLMKWEPLLVVFSITRTTAKVWTSAFTDRWACGAGDEIRKIREGNAEENVLIRWAISKIKVIIIDWNCTYGIVSSYWGQRPHRH
jgi:hypothetical protein